MKIFSLLVALSLSVTAFAGGLEFNQILKINDVTQTVPAGKVWKVVSYMQYSTRFTDNTQTTTCSSTGYHTPFLVDGNYYFVFEGSPGHGSSSSAAMISVGNQLPLWLPEGTTLATVCTQDFLSVIEFDVIP